MEKQTRQLKQTLLICQTIILVFFCIAVFFFHFSGWWFILAVAINALLVSSID
jgi:uncharacterized membrane protein YdbT with pleckstrin-like domain